MCAIPRPRILPALLAFLLAFTSALAQDSAPAKRTLVELNTTAGRMVVALYNETPQHRDHFLALVKAHAYDSSLFHRVVPGFMLQGGTVKEPGVGLEPEIRPGLLNLKGALVAVPGQDPNTGEQQDDPSEFFVVQGQRWSAEELHMVEKRNAALSPGTAVTYTPEQIAAYVSKGGAPRLDGGYTVFGQVLEGLDVIDRIAALPCDQQDKPLTDVRMWMRILQ
jgi:peptidyl-prolyl cis-trans isomerase B (cyclophilin B)